MSQTGNKFNKLIGVVTVLSILLPQMTFAAIARDVHGITDQGGGSALPVTLNLTLGGTATLLTVEVAIDHMGSDEIVGCTWNTTETMTRLVANTTNQEVYLYGLVNPTTGAHTISCTKSGVTNRTALFGISYSGTDTTSVPTVTASGTSASATSVSATLTAATNSWIVGVANNDQNGGTTMSTGETIVDGDQGGFNARISFDSNGTVSGSQTATANNLTAAWGIAIANIQVPGAAIVPTDSGTITIIEE